MIQVQVRLDDNAVLPKYATPGSSGVDLVTTHEVMIQPGQTVLISTGLGFGLPQGIEVQIRPRSGLSNKTKLRIANTPGTIDEDYIGEIKIIVDNISQVKGDSPILNLKGQIINMDMFKHDEGYYDRGTYVIPAGTKIAQAVFAYVVKVELKEVLELASTERGAGGFGHTGIDANKN